MAEASIDPTQSQLEAFAARADDGPLEMLNLLRFRARALYPDRADIADPDVSGSEAYARYGAATAPLLVAAGGHLVWHKRDGFTLIGPADEVWDAALLVSYPNKAAFLGMIQSAAYRAIVVHRQAAVLTSRLIRWPGAPDRAR